MKQYSKIRIALKYLRYLVKSRSRYRVHSPFVFDLIQNCFHEKKWFYALEDLKNYQEKLSVTGEKLPFEEMGAGKNQGIEEIKIKSFYKKTKRPFKYYRLLFNLSRYFQPRQMLELGTGLGLSTLPMAGGSRLGTLHTIDGNKALSDFAERNLRERGYPNIQFHQGKFSSILPDVLKRVDQLDLVFLDGNHRYQPTLDYFNLIRPKLHDESLVIMDDIHWSSEMENAWNDLYSKAEVTVSIDLFFFGILFFKSGTEKQHFTLHY